MRGCQGTQVYSLQRVRVLLTLWALLSAAASAPAAAQAPLDAARQLYNQGKFDAVVSLATTLRANPVHASGAGLVLGRAYLERFRLSGDRADLVAAREVLRGLKPANFGPQEQAEYLVGLGESLYLEDAYGAAAEIFVCVLDRTADLGHKGSDRVFDWWAASLDRLAQSGLSTDPDALYGEILTRAQAALAGTPGLGAPAYWAAVAARSLGDVVRAWDLAVAGWIRAPLTEGAGETLRADLDRLVLQAIIPERSRQMASTDADRERAASTLKSAWDDVKRDWSPR